MSRNGRILSPPRPSGPHIVRRRFQGILGKRRTIENLGVLGQDYAGKPVALVGINSNDFLSYPEDTPAKMGEHAHRWHRRNHQYQDCTAPG